MAAQWRKIADKACIFRQHAGFWLRSTFELTLKSADGFCAAAVRRR